MTSDSRRACVWLDAGMSTDEGARRACRGPLLCVAACPRALRLSALKPAEALTRHALLPVMDTESPQRSQSHFLLINRALAFCQRVFWVFLGGALRMLGAGVAFQAVTFVKGRA